MLLLAMLSHNPHTPTIYTPQYPYLPPPINHHTPHLAKHTPLFPYTSTPQHPKPPSSSPSPP